MNFRTDAEKSNSIKIFEHLLALVVDETTKNFMQSIYEMFLDCHFEKREKLFEFCMDRWYLTEANKHRALVQRLIDNPQLGFSPHIIYVLHSDIQFIGFNETKATDPDTIYKIIDCLSKMDVANGDVIGEVATILWAKVDKKRFSDCFYDKLPDETVNRERFEKMASVEWLAATKIGERIKIDPWRISLGMWKVFMPFTTEVTGDVYLAPMNENLKRTLSRIKRKQRSGLERCARPTGTAFDRIMREWEETLERFLKSSERDCLEKIRRLNEDDELAKFCVDGSYRVKCTLAGLCRAEIRKVLLKPKSKKSHSQLIRDVAQLGLPVCLQQFLLFNYSRYVFKPTARKREIEEEPCEQITASKKCRIL